MWKFEIGIAVAVDVRRYLADNSTYPLATIDAEAPERLSFMV